ncbi:hypothetical protein QMK19_20865 [Streptomyces sp. H10-C2]|uniref:hypothetical protein n=1 Tax=unclassified Streptomyces TaxID=2593676 RepID=UPI0024B9B77B|nr:MULTISPECIES: hypothetical protein [unclassified Streptomyces]MDJ0344461.1 hypothetical protein [Streptomyces sp. PH10-H1]MDJ0372063.1 hypothetical protein [Streptomyces sp. H10-C2]
MPPVPISFGASFTHANLGAVPGWQRSLELRECQLALAGAIGRTSSLMRPRTPPSTMP